MDFWKIRRALSSASVAVDTCSHRHRESSFEYRELGELLQELAEARAEIDAAEKAEKGGAGG